jgi:hypothetical protein
MTRSGPALPQPRINESHDGKNGLSKLQLELKISITKDPISPSFEYQPSLIELNVSPSDWALFVREPQATAASTPRQIFLAVLQWRCNYV